MRPDPAPGESVRSAVGQIDGIEALRAVAVTWVVLFHYLLVREPAGADPWNARIAALAPANVVVRNGYLGVDLFFLITGFLLVLPWVRSAHAGTPVPDTLRFYRRRIRRIVPAYYAHLAILFALLAPWLLGPGFLRENAGLVAWNGVAHALFLHYTTPLTSASLSLNGALWTLALEAQFYLALPLLAPLFVRAPLRFAAGMLAAAAGWRWVALHDLEALVRWEMGLGARWAVAEDAIRHLLFTQIPGYLGHFAIGMGMGRLWLARPATGARRDAVLLTLLALAMAMLYWAYGLGGGAVLGPVLSWLVTLGALAVLTATLAWAGPVTGAIFLHRPMLFVGRVSYSVYLWHLPLLLAWNRLHVLEGSAWSLPIYLAVVLAVAWCSYEGVEKRFMGR